MDLYIKDFVGANTALAPSKGYPIHDAIKESIDKKETVFLDFHDMELITTAFLNAAIGKLYAEFTSDILNQYLKIKFISPTDVVLLKKVIDTAKLYFKDPEGYERLIKEKLNG